MGFHTFDADQAARLEDPDRYRWVSSEELVGAVVAAADAVVADLGSGTGFYTDDVAPHVGTVYGVDVQPRMHEAYREKGLALTDQLLDLAYKAVERFSHSAHLILAGDVQALSQVALATSDILQCLLDVADGPDHKPLGEQNQNPHHDHDHDQCLNHSPDQRGVLHGIHGGRIRHDRQLANLTAIMGQFLLTQILSL